jgi:L-alanine-DL-glutamate epimerase-like enolase superfamily enzyme
MTTVDRVDAAAYTVPTDAPESDGTLAWEATTMVVVHVEGGGRRGLGWTYADPAVAALVSGTLAPVIAGADAMSPPAALVAMERAVRNLGRPGLGQMAVSAVDLALWDLKAKLLDLPLHVLLGPVRDAVPVYGSGGFTSYDDERLAEQLSGWVAEGIPRVKLKVGRDPERDPGRVRAARAAIGDGPELFVDANGAYARKQALVLADTFRAQAAVSWLEEPVPSDDLEGLRLLRDRAPAGMAVSAGEYGWDAGYFRRMLAAEAVDVLQADVTRCGGVTGFARVGALCAAHHVPLSAHCAPAATLAVGLAVDALVHLEWFHDHVRVERLLLDGAPVPHDGAIRPDPDRPGLGVELKATDAEAFRA